MSLPKNLGPYAREKSTWAGLAMVFFAAREFLSGAGTRTPQILNEAGEAAAQVGEAVASGMDPLTAALVAGYGALMAVVRTSSDG